MSLSIALATPSYAGDLERCRLLCASIDRFVSGQAMHYLLVEDADVPLFRALEGPQRRIVSESELLPRWLKPRRDPLAGGRRRIWTGLGALARGVPPLRGWHAQQLRKLALARLAPEEALLFADSDMLFLRPFAIDTLMQGERLRLYRKPGGITAGMREHRSWCEGAARLLGLEKPALPSPDYINNLVSWRREHVLALLAHIERRSGRDWVRAVAGQRAFSEYMIYGYFAEFVLGLETARLWADERELCKVYWGGDTAEISGLSSFEEVMAPYQVAVGVQSFTNEPIDKIRTLFEAQSKLSAPAGAAAADR